MIDKIKFHIENVRIIDDIIKTKFIRKRDSIFGKEVYLYDHFNSPILGKNNISDDFEVNEEDEDGDLNYSKRQNLYILFFKEKNSPTGKLVFHQNLRRNWIRYSNNNSDENPKYPLYDLTYEDFVKIIDLYSNTLRIPKNIFWNARITRIELGANLKFNTKIKKEGKNIGRISLGKMLSCFGRLKNVNEKHTYGTSGICFKAKFFEVSIYDKLKRIVDTQEIFEKSLERKKLINRRKLNKVAFFLRYELRVLKVSQFNQSAFEGRISTLKQLKDSWNEILSLLFEITNDIEFYDFLSPEIEYDLLKTGLNGKGLKKFHDYLVFNGLKNIGYENFRNFIIPLVNPKVRTKFERDVLKINSEFRDNSKYGDSYQYLFLKGLESRLNSLKKTNPY